MTLSAPPFACAARRARERRIEVAALRFGDDPMQRARPDHIAALQRVGDVFEKRVAARPDAGAGLNLHIVARSRPCRPCRRVQVPYCASVTFSIQSTLFPSSASAIAIWDIAMVAAAPCQCFSPGANQTMSPGRTSSLGLPST